LTTVRNKTTAFILPAADTGVQIPDVPALLIWTSTAAASSTWGATVDVGSCVLVTNKGSVASLNLLSSDPLGSNAAGRKSPVLELWC